MKAIPKEVKCNAYRWDGSMQSTICIRNKEPTLKLDFLYHTQNQVYYWSVITTKGPQELQVGDVIIKLGDCNFHICSYEIFRTFFDIVET